MATLNYQILIRRGNAIPSLEQGELFYKTDEQKIYIGNAEGEPTLVNSEAASVTIADVFSNASIGTPGDNQILKYTGGSWQFVTDETGSNDNDYLTGVEIDENDNIIFTVQNQTNPTLSGIATRTWVGQQGFIEDETSISITASQITDFSTAVNEAVTGDGTTFSDIQTFLTGVNNPGTIGQTLITDGEGAIDWSYPGIYGKAQSPIAKGQAVQFASVQGDHILFKPAVQSEINANPDYFIGIADKAYNTNDKGYILTSGQVVDIDTATNFDEGEILWFDSSGSTAGALTNVEPTGLNAKIQVAVVSKEDATEGILVVRVNRIGTDVQDIKASGTPSSSNFLRGDGQWAEVAAQTNPEWNYVNTITGTTSETFVDIDATALGESFDFPNYDYRFVYNGGKVGEDLSAPYIQFNNDTGTAKYSYLYTRTQYTTASPDPIVETNSGDDSSNSILTGVGINGPFSDSGYYTELEIDFTVNRSFNTGQGAFGFLVRGGGSGHYLSATSQNYLNLDNGLVNSSFAGVYKISDPTTNLTSVKITHGQDNGTNKVRVYKRAK